jgi:hypothetical protein
MHATYPAYHTLLDLIIHGKHVKCVEMNRDRTYKLCVYGSYYKYGDAAKFLYVKSLTCLEHVAASGGCYAQN